MSQRDHDFDAQMRALHGASLRQLTPPTLGQLRAARAQASPSRSRRAWPWLAATAFSGLLAIGVGLQFLPRTPSPGAAPATVASSDAVSGESTSTVNLLEENPDLYLWLASTEAQPLAME